MATFRSGVKILGHVSKKQGCNIFRVRSFSDERSTIFHRRQRSGCSSPESRAPVRTSRSWFSLFQRKKSTENKIVQQSSFNEKTIEEDSWLSIFKKKTSKELPQPLSCHNHEKQIKNEEVFKEIDEEEGSEGQKQSDKDDAQVSKEEVQVAKKEVPGTEDAKQDFSTLTEESKNAIHCELCPEAEQKPSPPVQSLKPSPLVQSLKQSPPCQSLKPSLPVQSLEPSPPVQSLVPQIIAKNVEENSPKYFPRALETLKEKTRKISSRIDKYNDVPISTSINMRLPYEEFKIPVMPKPPPTISADSLQPSKLEPFVSGDRFSDPSIFYKPYSIQKPPSLAAASVTDLLKNNNVQKDANKVTLDSEPRKLSLNGLNPSVNNQTLSKDSRIIAKTKIPVYISTGKIKPKQVNQTKIVKKKSAKKLTKQYNYEFNKLIYKPPIPVFANEDTCTVSSGQRIYMDEVKKSNSHDSTKGKLKPLKVTKVSPNETKLYVKQDPEMVQGKISSKKIHKYQPVKERTYLPIQEKSINKNEKSHIVTARRFMLTQGKPEKHSTLKYDVQHTGSRNKTPIQGSKNIISTSKINYSPRSNVSNNKEISLKSNKEGKYVKSLPTFSSVKQTVTDKPMGKSLQAKADVESSNKNKIKESWKKIKISNIKALRPDEESFLSAWKENYSHVGFQRNANTTKNKPTPSLFSKEREVSNEPLLPSKIKPFIITCKGKQTWSTSTPQELLYVRKKIRQSLKKTSKSKEQDYSYKEPWFIECQKNYVDIEGKKAQCKNSPRIIKNISVVESDMKNELYNNDNGESMMDSMIPPSTYAKILGYGSRSILESKIKDRPEYKKEQFSTFSVSSANRNEFITNEHNYNNNKGSIGSELSDIDNLKTLNMKESYTKKKNYSKIPTEINFEKQDMDCNDILHDVCPLPMSHSLVEEKALMDKMYGNSLIVNDYKNLNIKNQKEIFLQNDQCKNNMADTVDQSSHPMKESCNTVPASSAIPLNSINLKKTEKHIPFSFEKSYSQWSSMDKCEGRKDSKEVNINSTEIERTPSKSFITNTKYSPVQTVKQSFSSFVGNCPTFINKVGTTKTQRSISMFPAPLDTTQETRPKLKGTMESNKNPSNEFEELQKFYSRNRRKPYPLSDKSIINKSAYEYCTPLSTPVESEKFQKVIACPTVKNFKPHNEERKNNVDHKKQPKLIKNAPKGKKEWGSTEPTELRVYSNSPLKSMSQNVLTLQNTPMKLSRSFSFSKSKHSFDYSTRIPSQNNHFLKESHSFTMVASKPDRDLFRYAKNNEYGTPRTENFATFPTKCSAASFLPGKFNKVVQRSHSCTNLNMTHSCAHEYDFRCQYPRHASSHSCSEPPNSKNKTQMQCAQGKDPSSGPPSTDPKCKRVEEVKEEKRGKKICKKLPPPGCKIPEKTDCLIIKELPPCTKRLAPKQSYSECLKEKTPPLPFTECNLEKKKSCPKYKHKSFDGCKPKDKQVFICFDPRKDKPKMKQKEDKGKKKKEDDECKEKGTCDETEKCKFRSGYSKPPMKCSSISVSQNNLYPIRSYSNLRSEFSYRRSLPVKAASYTNCNVNNHLKNRLLPLVCKKEEKSIECLTETFKGARLIEYPEPSPRQIETVHDGPFRSRIKSCFENKGKKLFRKKYDTDPDDSTPACPKKEKKDEKCKGLQFATGASTSTNLSPISSGNTMKYSISKSVESKELTKKNYIPEYLSNKNASLSMNILPVKTGISRYVSSEALITTKTGFSHSKSSDHLMKNYGSLFFRIKNGTIANISNSKENSDEHAKSYLKSEKNLEHGFTCIEKCDSVNYGISVNPNIMSQTTKFTSINKYNGSLKKLEQANNIHCIALSNTENSYVRETGHNSISEKPKDELENTSKRNAFHALNRLEDNKIDKNLKSTTTDKSCNKESFISSEKNCFKTYHTGRIKFLEYFEEKEKVKNTFSRPAKGSNNKCFPNNSESKKAYKNNTDKSAVESFKSTPSKSGSMKIEFNDDIMNPFNTDIIETGQLERNKHSKICCSKNPEGSLNRKLNCKSKSETLENNNDLKNESTCSTCSKEVQDIMEGKENVTHLSSSNIIGSWKQEKLEHEKCSKDNISIVPVPKNELNLCNKAEYAVNSNKDCAVEDLITTIKSWFSFLKAKQEISEIESRKQENEVESNFSMNSKSIKNDTSEYPKEIKIINPECSVSRNEITEKNLSEVCSRETKIVQSIFSEASNKDKCNGISKEENTVAKCNNGKHSNKCTEGNQCCEMKPQHATGEHSLDNKKLSKDCRKILSSIPSLSKKELFHIKKFVKQSTSKNIKFKTRTQNITPSACEKYFNHHKQTIKASKPILSMELNYSEKIQLGKQHRKVTNNLGKPKKITTLQSNPCLRKNKSEMPFVEKNTISEIMNYENLADEVNNKNCQLANVSDSSFKKAIKNSAGILEASEVYPNCDSRKDEGSVTSTIINRIEKSEISFCSSEDISSQKLKSTSTQSINNNSANYTIEQNEVSDTVKLVSSASNVLQSEEAAKTKNCQEISCITSPMMKELGCTVNNKSAISYPPFIKDNSILEPNLSTTSSSTNVIIPLKRIPLVRIAKSNKLIPSPISKSKYKYALRPELLRITKAPSGNRQYTELVSVLLHPDEINIIVPLNISELADECATREKEQIYELNEQIANENGYLALIKRFSVKIGSALGYNYFNDISSEPQSSIQMKHVNCQDTPNQVHPGLNCILEKNLNQQYQETKAEENYLAHSSNKNAGFRSGLTYLEYLNQSSRFDIKNSDLIYGLNISELTFCQIQYMLSSRILPVSNYLFLKYKEWLFTVHGGEIPYNLDHVLNQYILYSRKILPKTSCPNCNILTTNKINYTESPIFMFKTRSQLNFSFTKCNMPHSSYRMKTFLTVPCTAHIIPRYKNTGNSFCDSILKMFIKIKINERHEKNKKMCENEKKTEESCEKTVESIKEVKKDCETKKDKPYIECKEPPKENVHKCDKEENKKSIEHKEECIKDQEPRNKDLPIEKSPTTCAQEAHEDTKNVEVESVCPPIKRYIIKKQNQAQKFSPSEVEPHKKELSVETEGIQVKDYCASVSDKAMKKDVNNLKKNRERVEDYCSSSIKTVNKSNIIEEQQQRKRNDERQDFRRDKVQSPSVSKANVEALSTALSKEIKKKESKIKPVTDKPMSKEKDKSDCPSLPETTDEYCYMLKEDCKKDKSEHIKQERKEVIDCSNNESTVKQVIATAKKDESKSVAKYDECKNDNSAHENGKNQERMKDETSKIKTKDKEINVNVAKKKPTKEEIEERKKAFYVTQLSPIKNPPSNPPCNGDSSDIACPPCPPCPTTDPFCLPVDPTCSSVEPPCPTVELPCPTESCKPPKPENPQPPSPSESLKPPESQGPDLLCQPKAVKPPEPQGSDPPCLPESIKPPESQGPDLLCQPKAVKPPEPQGSDPPCLPESIKPLEPQGSVEPVKPSKPNGPVAPEMCKPQDPSPPEPPEPKDPESPCPLKLVKPPGPQGPVPPEMCKPQDPSPPVPVKPPELQGLEPPCLPGPVKQPESVGPEASSPPCKPCPPCPLEQVKPPKSKGSEPPSLPESSKQPKPICQEEIRPSNKPPEHLDIKISTEVYPEKSSTMKPLPPPPPPTKHPSSIPESFACPPEKTPISKENIKGAKEPSSNNIPKQSHSYKKNK